MRCFLKSRFSNTELVHNSRTPLKMLLIFALTGLPFLCVFPAWGSLFKMENEGGNLFQNSGFEKSVDNNPAGWQVTTFGGKGGKLTMINDNLVAHSGNMCAKLEATGSPVGVMQSTKIWPGKKYIFRVYAKADNKSKLFIDLHLYKMEGYHLKALDCPKDYKKRYVFDISDKWQEYNAVFTVPEETHSMNISTYSIAKEPVYIDDATLMGFHPATVRFLPSIERLVVNIDSSIYSGKAELKNISAEVNVYREEDQERKKAVLSHTVSDFKDSKAVWRCSTKDLPEGDYTVDIQLKDGHGNLLARDDDWFKKKIFPWMENRPWESEQMPAPYTPLKAENKNISPWGRTYSFNDSGLFESLISQNRELLAEPMSFSVKVDGKDTEILCEKAFSIVSRKPGTVSAKSQLKAGNLELSLDINTEYDGFTLYRLTYRPVGDSMKIDRLRLKIPLKYENAFLYSAGTDNGGKTIPADVFPDRQGKLYDSSKDTNCQYCSPNFCTLFWVGGYHTCFCYAADSDKGWILRDNAPAVEVFREGDQIIMWLNLIDRECELKKSGTLEFAFQAGPLKPLPEGWRGIQDEGDPDDAPRTASLAKYSGSGVTCGGGANFIYPGATQEIRDKWVAIRKAEIAGGNRAIYGYHYYGTVPKGLEEAKVFRSEWGIDRDTWDSVTSAEIDDKNWMWKNRFFGDEKERYLLMMVTPTPSYVDCATYGYNEVLKYLPFSGFYDDCGFTRPAYDEELGLGGRDSYGREIYSSGLWIYRKRWKDAAYVNWLNSKPNFLRDSQHVKAHYMPAYGFIGMWAPSEHGYYNLYENKDILEFYGSLKRYLAYNPAYQFGQIPMVGLSTMKWEEPGSDKDTRCIMMVTMLHDHDVGSFGNRNLRTVCQLRAGRNIFKQWDKDVKFTGYWENGEFLKTSSDNVKVSLYTRPGSSLFIIGNAGETDTKADLRVEWGKLGINPKSMRLINTESMTEIKPSGNGFSLDVPRHDIRLVLAGDLKGYELPEIQTWDKLPKPDVSLDQLGDTLKGPALSPKWEKVLHEGKSGVGFLNNRLYIQGNHYGYAMIREKLNGEDNISAQCVIARSPSGGNDSSAGSLFLFWKDGGAYLQAGISLSEKKFSYIVNGRRIPSSEISSKSTYGWYPYLESAVKIKLTPDNIEFYGSADGKTWSKAVTVKRSSEFSGAPEYLALGNGHRGEKPYLANTLAKYFNSNAPSTTFFTNVIAGKDK